MTTRELNEKTLELLRQKMEEEDTVLIIAITSNLKTQTYSQVVGYGVTMELLANAFMESYENLTFELAMKKKS